MASAARGARADGAAAARRTQAQFWPRLAAKSRARRVELVALVAALVRRRPYPCGALLGAGFGLAALGVVGVSWAGVAFVGALANACGGTWRAVVLRRGQAALGAGAGADARGASAASALGATAAGGRGGAGESFAPRIGAGAGASPPWTPGLGARATRAVPVGLASGSCAGVGAVLAAAAWPAAAAVAVAAACVAGALVALLGPRGARASHDEAQASAKGAAAPAPAGALRGLWAALGRTCSNPFRVAVVVGALALVGAFTSPAFAGAVLTRKLLGSLAAASLGWAATFLWTRPPQHLMAAGASGALVGLAAGLAALGAGVPLALGLGLAAASTLGTAIVVYGLCAATPGVRASFLAVALVALACWLGLTPAGIATFAALRAWARELVGAPPRGGDDAH